MKKLTFTELQRFRLQEAHRHASVVLSEIKARPLSGEPLALMKHLEEAVGTIQAVLITVPPSNSR